MSELNREQIIKALECLTGEEVMFCRECAYNTVGAFSCKKELAKDALSLIKELTAKTEAQDIVITELRKLLEKANHDADRYARKIKELTEEVESLKQCMEHEHASFMETFGELDYKCKRLTEENEYLKQQNEIYAVLNEKMECICNSYAFQYGTVIPKEVFLKKEREKAVKEMQERLMECFNNEVEYLSMYTESQVIFVIDQIAKEMIGEGND